MSFVAFGRSSARLLRIEYFRDVAGSSGEHTLGGGGRLVRKLAVVAAMLAVVSISACKKTGEGEYQVEKPVVGTQTDTIHTPTVDVGTQTTTVAVPKVKMDSAKIKTPTVTVKKH
jgi:hypothetical protein